jgi:cell division protein FtsI (penicillin-binding protein 3)
MAQTTLNQRAKRGAARPRRVDAWRVWAMLGFFTVFGVYNLFTVFKLQVLEHSKLSEKAESRIKWKDTIQPRRGLIYDSRGQLLAGNITANDVYVDKTHRNTDTQLHEISDLLAPIIAQNPQELFTKLKEGAGTNIKVANRINDATRDKVLDLEKRYPVTIGAVVSLDPQPLRQYPNYGPNPLYGLAASVLGFADFDNQGHYGVEEFYNEQLGGVPGWIDAERDSYGRPLALEQPLMEPAVDGNDVVLTIDSAIQYLVERELKNSLEEFKADYGYAIVQDPQTGAILAMANYPSFDPNLFNKTPNFEAFKNPVVNDIREPGSTAKILTYASALDAGAIMSTTSMYGSACVSKYGRSLCNATYTNWGWQTMAQGLGRSDNVAAIFAADQLGETRYYEYLRAFGIGKRTGIDLAGEVAGLVRWPDDDGYSPVDLYTAAFGQNTATTPIQLVNAVSAVANGGTLLKPFVMKEIRKDGQVIERNEREEVRTVIKPSAARDIADMLSAGVEGGMVARLARVPGYHVSVKTGTANVLNAEGTDYLSDVTFASAMGFGPSNDARFTLYIGLMHPRTSQWGENTASISWGRIAREILLYMKVQPTEPLPTATPTP